ncbi:MAG: UvrD-helicase domain-containing protein [Methylotenera sp.]|nr:UvrD-helicase domain-containing protein [Oligoflexia bacterium]
MKWAMIDFDSAPDSSGPRNRFWKPAAPTGPAVPARVYAEGELPDYVNSLNEMQKAAVLITEGPLIVLAGAGSGKTKMLTSRIAYLMDVLRVPAHNIMAVTFTNKASKEMRERVERHLGEGHSGYLGAPEIGTFHSVCVRLLRREQAHTPFTKPFVIYDDSDQLSLIKGVVSKLGIDDKAFSPKSFQAAINGAKCDATEPKDIEPAPHNLFERQFKRVYEQYQKDLFANNALDFGEIICMAYRILRDDTSVRAKYQHRFRYIHVDEYQDTNRSQYLLLSMLAGAKAGGHQNICVVGDEDQSIYKWRGADIRNILDFEIDYPGAQIVKLEQNYRSTQTIITAAGQVIKNNKERKDKTLWTENEVGIPINRVQLPDERAEAEMIISEIKRLAAYEGRSYKDFAIFYRTHAQSRQFEDVFRREKIPYQIVGGLRFYDRKEIKDILSYFKVVLNPQDSISLKRVINTPARGIGKTTLDKLDELQLRMERSEEASPTLINEKGELEDTSFWSALRRAAKEASVTSAGTAKKLATFVGFIERLIEEQPRKKLSELYHYILDETGYVSELRKEGTEEAFARIENLEEFDTLLQEFEEDQFEKLLTQPDRADVDPDELTKLKTAELLSLFIEESALASDVGNKEPLAVAIQMMTLHSSKGLEYPVVFLPGMEEGLFPSVRPWEEAADADVEEERRLCYVGMTRAREVLYMTNVVVRRLWGNVTYQEPARFFAEIPDELVEFKDLSHGTGAGAFRAGSSRQLGYSNSGAGGGKFGSASRERDDFNQDTEHRWNPSPAVQLTGEQSVVGKKIKHPDYGLGKILASDGSGNDQKVTIEFSAKDRRKFLLRFVKDYIQ